MVSVHRYPRNNPNRVLPYFHRFPDQPAKMVTIYAKGPNDRRWFVYDVERRELRTATDISREGGRRSATLRDRIRFKEVLVDRALLPHWETEGALRKVLREHALLESIRTAEI